VSHEPRPNLVSLLDDPLPGDAPAFVCKTPYRRFSWSLSEIRTAALAFAARLREAGVGPGERVLLQGPDSPEWVAAFFGIAAAGAVIVPLDPSSTAEFAAKVARKTEARVAVVSARESGSLQGVCASVDPLEALGGLRRLRAPLPPPHRAAPEDTAEIVFTSGTTAQPKGVELTHANLLTSLAGIEAGFRKREALLRPLLPMRFLCLVPLSHLFGQSLGIFVPILMRSTAVFSSTLTPARLLALVRSEKPLAIITVPRVLAGLRAAVLREIEARGAKDAFRRSFERSHEHGLLRRILATRQVRASLGWRTHVLVVGGAALEAEIEDFWSRCGFALIQGYGMTEAAPIIAVHNPLDRKARTLGRALGHLEVRLAEDGEVLVRGPNVMKGYYRDPEATHEAIQNGWLRTGDLAEQDAEGRLYFKGRKKDVIVLAGGLNVHPSDVESVLASLPGIRDAVVFAGRGGSGDEVHAAILAGPEEVDAERVRRDANERLLPHQRIRRLLLWGDPDFPRTSTGKIRRGEVAAAARILESLPDRGASRVAAPSAAFSRVAAALSRFRQDRGNGQDPSARLQEDLGLDSLDVVELLSLLEEEHDVAFPDEALRQGLTVSGLERLLGEQEREHGTRAEIPMPRWSRRWPLRLLRSFLRPLLLRPLFWLYVGLDVEGRERARAEDGPFLVVANHTSVLDAAAILFALPRELRGRLAPAMAAEALPARFDPAGKSAWSRLSALALYGIAAGAFCAYPFPQTRGFRPSLEYTGELIDAGFSPLVFPEGRMTRTGGMTPFKAGIGLLATETRVAVLPVHLDGLAEILPPASHWPRKRGRARVRIGSPLLPDQTLVSDPQSATRAIEKAVRDLGDPSVGS